MTTRLTIVILVSLFSIALWAPDLPRVFGQPLGTPGFKVGHGTEVVSVDRGSPAERAGIRVGDHIDFTATPLHSRILIVNVDFQNLHPLQRFPVVVQRGDHRFAAMVSSEPETRADTATVLPRMIFELIILAAGIALVLLRPSKATWGFFIFAAFNPGVTINSVIWYGPPAYQIAMTVWSSTGFSMTSQLGALVFALYILVKPPIARWRRIAEALAYTVAIGAIVLAAWSVVAAVQYGTPLSVVNNFTSALEITTAIVPPVLLLVTYASSDARARERIRWVTFAFTVNAVVMSVFFMGEVSAITIPYWLWGTMGGIDSITVAFTVSYAVLKHHIVDINVAISRAVVYTILSAMAVGAFALVDMFFTRAVSSKSAGLMADIGLALILGFFFNSMHARVDRFVDRVLFRHRHKAEQHLRTVMHAMPFAVSDAQVDRLVVEEPVRSFALAGAVLFAADENGTFELRHYFGISPPRFSLTSREDALPVYLQGERRALRLNSHGWNIPAIAIPVFSHGDLAAICVYGLHENGTDLDTEEIALFEDLTAAAGNAYDRLEAKRLRDEVRELRLTRV